MTRQELVKFHKKKNYIPPVTFVPIQELGGFELGQEVEVCPYLGRKDVEKGFIHEFTASGAWVAMYKDDPGAAQWFSITQNCQIKPTPPTQQKED